MDHDELAGLPGPTRALLDAHGFDAEAFARLRDELRSGRFPTARNRLRSGVEPPAPSDITPWPKDAAAADAAGAAALRGGQVAALILNGGMATRFGGVVKGVVEVVDGHSFLALRLGDVARRGPVTAFLMNSFATDAGTRDHLRGHDSFGLPAERLHLLTQRISLRLTPEGEVFRDAAGRPSPYAPGHGDVFEVLAESEGFARFVEGGGRYVMIGNVDNLGATMSPTVLGAHIQSGRQVTVEVAPRHKGDKGGAPARVDGRVEVVEEFRFPEGFDVAAIPVFNTNTIVCDVAAIRGDYDLTWFRADKDVDGKPVVQFERLMGEVTAFCDATYLRVPREGAHNRFLPVKTPADLDTVRPHARAMLEA